MEKCFDPLAEVGTLHQKGWKVLCQNFHGLLHELGFLAQPDSSAID